MGLGLLHVYAQVIPIYGRGRMPSQTRNPVWTVGPNVQTRPARHGSPRPSRNSWANTHVVHINKTNFARQMLRVPGGTGK